MDVEDIDTTPPGKISNLCYKVDASGLVIFYWKNPSDEDFAGMKLRIIDADNIVVLEEELSAENETYSTCDLCEKCIYTVLIYTFDESGNHSDAVMLNIQSGDMHIPGPITDLFYEVKTDGSVEFTWENPSDEDFSGVLLRVIDMDNGIILEEKISREKESYSTDKLSEKSLYTVLASAYDESENYSDQIMINIRTKDITAPHAPAELRSEVKTDGSVEFTWKNPSDEDFAGIKLRVCNEDLETVFEADIDSDVEKYVLKNLEEKVDYTVSLISYDADGNYSEAIAQSFRTEDITSPASVTNLHYSVDSDGNVIFIWNNPTDADFCGLSAKINPALPSFSEEHLSVSETTLVLSGFEHQKVYLFSLVAEDDAGNKSKTTDIKYMLPLDIDDDSWFLENPVTAHAGGGMIAGDNKYIYTNCKEAIEKHYEDGFRLFEVDMDFTLYKTPVLCHDWTSFASMANLQSSEVSLEIFKNSTLYDLYSPTTLEDLVDLMIQYQDMYVDIDSKGREPSVWVPALVSYCEQRNALDILDRFIIEFYNEDNWNKINAIYAFKNYFYTDYLINSYNALTDAQHKSVLEFLIKKNIPYYETNDAWLNPEIIELYHSYNIKIITWGTKSHDPEQFHILKEMGVDAIQSDWVTNEMWESTEVGNY